MFTSIQVLYCWEAENATSVLYQTVQEIICMSGWRDLCLCAEETSALHMLLPAGRINDFGLGRPTYDMWAGTDRLETHYCEKYRYGSEPC